MADLDEIYNTRLLELAGATTRATRLAVPLPPGGASATAHSKLCGSTISLDLVIEGGAVTDYGQTVKACLLGQAAASVIANHIIGATPDDLRSAGAAMRAMLKDNGLPPQGRFADLAALEPVRAYRARHASTLLVFDALDDALSQIEARNASQSTALSGAAR